MKGDGEMAKRFDAHALFERPHPRSRRGPRPQGELADGVGGGGQERLNAHPVPTPELGPAQPAALLAIPEHRLDPDLAAAEALPGAERPDVGHRPLAHAPVVGADDAPRLGRPAAGGLERACRTDGRDIRTARASRG